MLETVIAGRSGGQLAFLLASALVAGLARGFSGFGAALIFVPLGSAAVGPKLAVPLLLAVDFVTTLGMLPRAWRSADRRDVATMSAGALVGVPLGAAVLARADPLLLRWAISGLVVAMLALLVSGWRYGGRPRAPVTVLVGTLAGFGSGAAQTGGPPVVAYWLGGASDRQTVRANIVLYFAVVSLFSIVAYVLGGLFGREVLALALLVGPAYAAGLLAGARLFDRSSEAVFRRACFVLIAAAAIIGLPALDGVLR